MSENSFDENEVLSPRRLAKLGVWIRETVRSLSKDIGNTVNDDFAEISPPLRKTKGTQTSENFGYASSAKSSSVAKPFPCSIEMINLLSSDSTYLKDPSEREEFEAYFPDPMFADLLLEQFPSLRMRIEHYKAISVACEEKRILKRLLYRIYQLRRREEAGMVLVDRCEGVLVERLTEPGQYVAWS